ncbi:MAG: hypothetical protein JRC86_00540 [Deltaproteobacteria bacterium]|nr:hypothetical protein [Deltaproteobacteria bacterium]
MTENERFIEECDDFLKGMEGEPSAGSWECPECGTNWDVSDGVCEDCGYDSGNDFRNEFSWSHCDQCGTSLGGARTQSIGWVKGAREAGFDDDHRWDGELCDDCVLFNANGDLPFED